MMAEVRTLADALPEEMARVREAIAIYKTVPMGHIAAALMQADIDAAMKAIMHGDTVEMLRRYESLKGWEV